MQKKGIKLLIIFIFIISFNKFYGQDIDYSVHEGVIDVSSWDAKNDGIIELSGQWEFYWSKLLSSSDFESKDLIPDAFLNVPQSWNNVKIKGKPLADTGYATLRLVIISDKEIPLVSFAFNEVVSAYDFWLNGKLLIEVGKVGTNSQNSLPRIISRKVTTTLHKGRNEIIVHVSNFDNTRSTFVRSPIVGSESVIYKRLLGSYSIDLIIIGFLLIMSIYYLSMFINKQEVSRLMVSLFLILAALWVSVTNNFVLTFFFPNLSLNFVYIISYFTFYSFLPLILFYVQRMYNEKRFKIVFYILYGSTLVFLGTLLLSPYIFIKLSVGYTLIYSLYSLFTLFLIIGYISHRRLGAIFLLITMIVLIYSGINDILLIDNLINSIILTPYALMFTFVMQTISYSKIRRNRIKQNNNLFEMLEYQNRNLGEIISERVKSYEEKNKFFIQNNEQLNQLNEKLIIYQTVIEQNPLPLIQANRNLIIEYSNSAFSNYSNKENRAQGLNVSSINFGTSIDGVYNANWKKLLEDKSVWSGNFNINIKNKKAIIRVNIFVIKSIEIGEESYVAIIQDVTKGFQIEADLVAKNNELLDGYEKLETVHNEILESISYAQIIHKALLANRKVFDKLFEGYMLVYRSRFEVGGNFYYANRIESKKIVVLGESSAGGIYGASKSVLYLSVIHEVIMNVDINSSKELLVLFHKKLVDLLSKTNIERKDALNIGICIIDGHNVSYLGMNILAFICNESRVEQLEKSNDSLKLDNFGKVDIKEINLKLSAHEKIYISTMSMIEQLNSRKTESYGKERLINLISKSEGLTAVEHENLITESLDNWIGSEEQEKDITIIGVKI